MENDSQAPEPIAASSPWVLPASASRHDGWTGERMAAFLETLADTGIVVDACLAACKSANTAYALRRRSPLFAAAWESALMTARERLADTLLARSIEGTVEQYFRNGELVGEKRVIDNRLGLAILRRLDRQSREQPSPDWSGMVDTLRTGDPAAIAAAAARIERETHETHTTPNAPFFDGDDGDDSDDALDLSDRCWQIEDMGEIWWKTNFPPPRNYDGWQRGAPGEVDYERDCSPEETELLDAVAAADDAREGDNDPDLRDAWFDLLRAELAGEDSEPGGETGDDAVCQDN